MWPDDKGIIDKIGPKFEFEVASELPSCVRFLWKSYLCLSLSSTNISEV